VVVGRIESPGPTRPGGAPHRHAATSAAATRTSTRACRVEL